ncbi:MAG: tRNA lysidine(34) synthetase TilS [Candidatus Omnitrophica bacterium]|nr:tRNA lysidine(34) synthetase TilS [Candidatus Omnitrophota bacterium]
MSNIFKKVEKFIEKEKLVEDKDKILLAVSGGPDSVFLFHFFIYFLERKDIEIKIAYIHHHLRKEADREVEFVKNLAYSYGIEFFKDDIKIEKKVNIEKVLREKRYEKLYQIAYKTKCNKIAVGHTLDDNVETVIMNFLRGTGISGLCGIWALNKVIPKSDIVVIRPLLCVEKKDIVEYLKKNKIEYLVDRSNFSLSFFRNKVRNELIPFFTKYNSSLKKQISKMASIIKEEEKFLRHYSEKIYEEIVQEKSDKIIVNVEKFNSLDIWLKRRIAGIIYKKVKNTFYINYRIIEKIVNSIEKGKSIFDNETIEQLLKNRKIEEEPFLYKLEVPGEIKFNKVRVKTEFVEFSEDIFKNKDSFTGFFDWAKINGEIIIRNRKEGDRFVPLGFKKEKKISRFMIDKKIPKHERDRVLIFENNGKIMWICGYQISEEFKVEKSTFKVLKITIENL